MINVIELISVVGLSIFSVLGIIGIVRALRLGFFNDIFFGDSGKNVFKSKSPVKYWIYVITGILGILIFIFAIIITVLSWF